MILKIGREAIFEVHTFEQASQTYAVARDESGEGMRTWPDGELLEDGVPIATISYNAKVWPLDRETGDGRLPYYDPYKVVR